MPIKIDWYMMWPCGIAGGLEQHHYGSMVCHRDLRADLAERPTPWTPKEDGLRRTTPSMDERLPVQFEERPRVADIVPCLGMVPAE